MNTKVHEYLEAIGFQKDAVGDEYTERPPRNMMEIYSNLDILSDVMVPEKAATYGTLEFLRKVKDEIYSTSVKHLRDETREALSVFLGIEMFNMSLNKVKELIKGHEIKRIVFVPPVEAISATPEQLEQLALTLQYLEQMELMDQNFDKRSDMDDGAIGVSKLEMSDVTPICGQVMREFYIHEQEHRTVVEMWSYQEAEGNLSSFQPYLDNVVQRLACGLDVVLASRDIPQLLEDGSVGIDGIFSSENSALEMSTSNPTSISWFLNVYGESIQSELSKLSRSEIKVTDHAGTVAHTSGGNLARTHNVKGVVHMIVVKRTFYGDLKSATVKNVADTFRKALLKANKEALHCVAVRFPFTSRTNIRKGATDALRHAMLSVLEDAMLFEHCQKRDLQRVYLCHK